MKFGEVFDYRNAEEARQYIGKKGLFSDYLRAITESPTECFEGTFRKVEEEEGWPFFRDRVRSGYQFFRPILEEDEPLMTNRQLAEWLAKGNGELSCEGGQMASSDSVYYKGEEDNSVSSTTLIRRWRDTEWVRPTKAIYEEDCR